MMRLLLRRCTLLGCLLAASSALAQPAAVAERYSLFPASADGIGKRYMGREISAVMGWQGAAWLEREERDREERTDLLLAFPYEVLASVMKSLKPGGRIVFVEYKAEDPRVPRLAQTARKSGSKVRRCVMHRAKTRSHDVNDEIVVPL